MLLDYLWKIAFAAAIVIGLTGIASVFRKGFLEKLFGFMCILVSIAFAAILVYLFKF